MNPYTYRKRGQSSSVPIKQVSFLSSSLSFAKAVFSSSVHPLVTFSFLAYAVVSVMSITYVAHEEIAQGEYSPISVVHSARGAVLGASVVAGLENAVPGLQTMQISYEPLDFNQKTGLWNYSVKIGGSGIEQMGSVTVGSKVFKNEVLLGGLYDTDYSLKPITKYEVTVWSEENKKGDRVATVSFVTPEAKKDCRELSCSISMLQ